MIMVAENTEGGMVVSVYDSTEEAIEKESQGRYWTERDTENLKAFGEEAHIGDYADYSKGYFIKVSSEVEVYDGEFGIIF